MSCRLFNLIEEVKKLYWLAPTDGWDIVESLERSVLVG